MRNLAIILLLSSSLPAICQQHLQLWYNRPASNWNEALPLGNGTLGAMVFGGAADELIQLNEQTLWSGGPANTNPNPQSPTFLPAIRSALAKGSYQEAEELAKKMQGQFTESYEPMADLHIHQKFTGDTTAYYRNLDISNATAVTKFTAGGTQFTREQFISAPDRVIVIRFTASKKNALNIGFSISSPLFTKQLSLTEKEVSLMGQAPSHVVPSYINSMEMPVVYNDAGHCRGMRFNVKMSLRQTGGSVKVQDTLLQVSDADEVTLFLVAATSFNGYDKCPAGPERDETAIASNDIKSAMQKSWDDLRQRHVTDYQHFYNRLVLQIDDASNTTLPTDARLKRYSAGADDNGLEVLYFQFGRYLLISSSRPGGLPANLQGVWNPHVRPPWSSNYTTNINTEMNYWMAESGNLPELHEPLIALIKNLSVTGRETAKNFYNAGGWVAHHNTDIWATSNPVSGGPMWANWPMGGVWLCSHLWEHYQFSGDRQYLENTAYPIMKGAAQFCLDWLVTDSSGFLVTSPSTSPENVFITDKGVKGSVSVASTMDMSLIRELFSNVIDACSVLSTDQEFMTLLKEKRAKLYPFKVGKKGNLQEWYKDWEDAEPGHRHISHLYGLFPGNQISPLTTPALATAASVTLQTRGDGGTGWSRGWKINTWARLFDGNHAHKLIRQQLNPTGFEGTDYTNAGGTYPNLFDAHPPFQIDGNFAGTSGMIEMLLQSQDHELHLLPALPTVWSKGSVTGLRGRGGFETDIYWQQNKLTRAVIHSSVGGTCRLRTQDPVTVKGVEIKKEKTPYGYLTSFETQAGKSYQVSRQLR